MEETAIPLHSWFWLIVPMSAVFLLSIVNYLRSRKKRADRIDNGNKPEGPDNVKKDIAGDQNDSGKDPSSG